MNDQHVWSLRGHKAATPMILRESAGKLEALTEGGNPLAYATYIHGTGWALTLHGVRRIFKVTPDKPAAVLALRHLVGETT